MEWRPPPIATIFPNYQTSGTCINYFFLRNNIPICYIKPNIILIIALYQYIIPFNLVRKIAYFKEKMGPRAGKNWTETGKIANDKSPETRAFTKPSLYYPITV